MTKGFSPVTFKLLTFSFLAFLLITANPTNVLASGGGDSDEEFDAAEMINHHILDSHEWHFFDGHYGTLFLPVILYDTEKGLTVFSSSNFYDEHHNVVAYNGYVYEHGHIVAEDGRMLLDFSITKNVAFLFLNAGLLLWIFLSVARGYKKRAGQAPKGVQSFFEPIIIFVRDEIVKPNIGPKYEKYLPYLLTLFFFIWFGNLLGLLPGAANLTGNIAVTIVLAFLTFLVTNFSGNKNYWKHIFNTPGVPGALKPIIVPVEIIGIFTKPFSLLVRLFVAITAGHIVILSLIALIFIFQSWAVGFGSTIIVTFINFIELLVATIQAYVFTMFSSLYIGLAIEEHHDDH
ncbi:MAG: F0F1 ATP synthase subunit A [bacterium]|nr:F0F1 ATP synthase subunit A [bacterium]